MASRTSAAGPRRVVVLDLAVGAFSSETLGMMAHATRSIPAYTPSLYLPGSLGRYRQYPRQVVTRIPGAGYKVGKLVWGEQVMNLDGSNVAPFNYDRVPLLGMGQSVATTLTASPLLLGLALIAAAQFAGRSSSSLMANRGRRNRRR